MGSVFSYVFDQDHFYNTINLHIQKRRHLLVKPLTNYPIFVFLVAMTVIIDKTNSKDISKILREKLKKSPKKGNLTKHFGKLKRNIDGLEYQASVRENED